jgi:hypothetical protein
MCLPDSNDQTKDSVLRNTFPARCLITDDCISEVNVQETWHQYADVADSGGTTLQSKPNGSAQILWRRDANQTGVQWAVVRVGKPSDPAFLVKVPSGGIPGRSGLATGSANCDLFQLDDSGTIEPVLKPNGQGVRIIARNPSAQRIRGPISNYDYDGNRSWNNEPLATKNCEK